MSGENVPMPPDVSLAQVVDVTPTAWRRVAEPVPGLSQQEQGPERSHIAAQSLSLTAALATTI